MKGPLHFKAAERLLARWQGAEREDAVVMLAAAQVHATLALAAATAELDAHEGPGGGSATGRAGTEVKAWDAAFEVFG